MLSKLLKYDFKSIKRFGLPAIIGLAVLTLISGFGTFGYVKLLYRLSAEENEIAASLFGMGGVLLLIAVITIIYIAVIGIYVVIMVDFYKFTATDEAYLTFTLPVKPKQIILSKLINAYGWIFVISILVVFAIASMVIGAVIGAIDIPELWDDEITVDSAVNDMVGIFDEPYIFGSVLNVVLMIIQAFIGVAHGLLMYFMAIFLGSVIAKKHKILAAIGCVFGVMALNGTITFIGQMILYVISAGVLAVTADYVLYQAIVTGAQVVYLAGMTVLYFFILKHMMEKKLNLP